MNKLDAKRAVARVLRVRARQLRKVVLLYHAVGEGAHAVSTRAFREQMEFLANGGHLASLPDLLDTTAGKMDQVAVSFDDGYACLADGPMSILAELGTSGTVFLNTGMIATGDRKLSNPDLGHYPSEAFLLWREVEQLAERGWTIGSHGVDHVDLTTANDDVVKHQLSESKRHIEGVLHADCQYFAYTWGHHSAGVRALVKAAGYRLAFSAEHGPIPADVEAMAVPRINVANEYTMDDFKAIVRGDWDYLGWVQRWRHRR